MILETERLILRRHIEADVEAEVEFFASDRAEFLGGKQSRELTWRTIAMLMGHWEMRGYGFFALEEKATGAYVGRAGPWFPEGWQEPEIGWTLMNGHTGKGYATEAGLASRQWAYDTLGWTTAISQIDPKNIGSIRVAERMGATYESDYVHERFGKSHIYRHPGPGDLS